MEKMKSTARKLDVFFKVLQICILIAAIGSGVGILLIVAFFTLQLDPSAIGTGYEMLDVGWMELEIAAEYLPDHRLILLGAAVQMVLALVLCLLGRYCAGCVRRLLAPMKEGHPFHEKAAECFRRLALVSVLMGVLSNAAVLAEKWLAFHSYRLYDVMTNGKILTVTPNYEVDLTFLAIAAVLLLLAYVFHYGQALQQQADETL